MSVGMFAIGAILFLVFLFTRLPEDALTVVPLLTLLLSAFISAFAQGAGLLGQISAGLSTVALALIVADLTRQRQALAADRSLGTLQLFVVPLLGILIVHNLLSVDSLFDESQRAVISTANPWGLAILLILILFSRKHLAALSTGKVARKILFRIVFWTSVVLGIIDLLVVAGVIAGNSAKVFEGIGGVGIANFSTNETGIFGCALVLWNLRSLLDRSTEKKAALVALAFNLFVIFLTKSRLALGTAMILIAISFLLSKSTRRFKVLVLLPTVSIAAMIVGDLIAARTAAEFTGGFSENPLANIPGSGRPAIWFFYVDALAYLANTNPNLWLFGVGTVGLTELYSLSPLEQIGLVTENIPFYPVHSDLIHILLASGGIGLILWFGILWRLARMRPKHSDRFAAIGAFLIFALATSGDMLIYVPFVTLLVLYAFMSSLDPAVELKSSVSE